MLTLKFSCQYTVNAINQKAGISTSSGTWLLTDQKKKSSLKSFYKNVKIYFDKLI